MRGEGNALGYRSPGRVPANLGIRNWVGLRLEFSDPEVEGKLLNRTRMNRNSRWNVAEPNGAAAELAQRLKTSTLIAQMLMNRGVSELGDCENFLRPSLKSLHEPALIPNLVVAAERIAKAIREGDKIVVYGDYDVDGITATAILWHA